MSQVMLLTADKPLPLCDRQEERMQTVTVGAASVSVTVPAGFAVREHSYYRDAVEELDYSMKPWQYELELEPDETDLAALRCYLEGNFASGEEVELWNLWVGDDALARPACYHGELAAFDMDALRQLLTPPQKDGGIGQCRMRIVI